MAPIAKGPASRGRKCQHSRTRHKRDKKLMPPKSTVPMIARLIGGAGTGKTHRLMETLDKVIATGVEPADIGFVTFTRAARAEAVKRASDRFNVPPFTLERAGWFRTIHSCCHKLLGVGAGQLLTDKASDREWIEEAIQTPVGRVVGSLGETVPQDREFATKGDLILNLWGAARACEIDLERAYKRARVTDWRLPSLPDCRKAIEQYEAAKEADDRLDFTDLLSRVAGVRFTVDGPEDCEPQGDPPNLVAWFHDEMQDASPLADRVFRRLIDSPRTRWVYLSGDPFQSIYLFAGADPKCFLGMPVTKEEVMGQSYRCGEAILSLGERILNSCSDYFDRRIKPAPHASRVDRRRDLGALPSEIDPRESWLVLARTNAIGRAVAAKLDAARIPWRPTAGNGGWAPTHRTLAIQTLAAIQRGEPVRPENWIAVLKTLPTQDRFKRGAKTFFMKTLGHAKLTAWPACGPDDYAALHVQESYLATIRSGEWVKDVPGAEDYLAATARYGQDLLDKPKVMLGTIHSVKGAEADNVALLTETSPTIMAAMSDPREYDAEQRVWYVAATRARKQLLLFDPKGHNTCKKGIPTS